MHYSIFLPFLTCCGVLPFLASAQLCEGRPGIVEYSDNFGAGPNPGPALPAGTTDYFYGAIGDGNYVVTNTTGLNGANWHAAPDHTDGDTNGYMLLFDASGTPGVFFERSIPLQCDQTRYEFSVWVANVVRPTACSGFSIEPDIRFEVLDQNGNLLGASVTGPIPTSSTLTWIQVGITCQIPAGVNSVTLRLLNNATGGCGNDLAIDDLLIRTCIPFTYQFFTICYGESVSVGDSVYFEPGLYTNNLNLPGDCVDSLVVTELAVFGGPEVQYLTICEGESIQVGNNQYSASGFYRDTIEQPSCDRIIETYLTVQTSEPIEREIWICEGDSLQVGTRYYRDAGTYLDTLISSFGCDSILRTTLSVNRLTLQLEPDRLELDMGETAILKPLLQSDAPVAIQWSGPSLFSCDTCLETILTATRPGLLTLRVGQEGTSCALEETIVLEVNPCTEIFIPNAFRPDDDGFNDFFTVFGAGCLLKVKMLEVYDRWGNTVYRGTDLSPNDISGGWDGTFRGRTVMPGVYWWIAELELADGSLAFRKGDVSIIR